MSVEGLRAKNILVIGGGAAGMMAALFAAHGGARVTILERNEKLGKKLYITGKGRCNLTNVAQGEDFLGNVLRNPRFLYAALAKLDSRGTMELMEQLGVPLKVERGGRVFPVSDRASDISAALRRGLERLGVELHLGTRVESLLLAEGRCRGVMLIGGGQMIADAVILCTGGLSYPSTGSDGDGYRLAAQAGHSVQQPQPALVPIETRESWPAMLSGLSLRNVALRAWRADGKKRKFFFDEQGEMLFTHFGVSGPLTLSLSSRLPGQLDDVRMEIDLKPALDEATLDARLLRDFREMSRKRLISVMDGLEPHSLGEQILLLAKISPNLPVNRVTHTQRAELVQLLKGLPLTPKGTRGFEEAIVTRGGVTVREVDPSTMQSKKAQGLYFAGELLDVDALTGGYNLQLAFSTGALAGASAAEADV